MKLREVFHPLQPKAGEFLFEYPSARGTLDLALLRGRCWTDGKGDVRQKKGRFCAVLHGMHLADPLAYLRLEVPDDAEVKRRANGRYVLAPRHDEEKWQAV